MTCWDCKYHKPVSVAFSFCKLKKRGISFMDIPKGCPSFLPAWSKEDKGGMMRFWTSYFGNVRNIPSDIVPVGIAGRSPKWWKGLEYKKLAPSWDIFSKWKYQHHDDGIYTARFNAERLGKLNFSNVVSELMKLSDNKDICLLCYEIPGMFCHRHLVAKWFTEHGFTTLELTKDSVRTVIQPAEEQPKVPQERRLR